MKLSYFKDLAKELMREKRQLNYFIYQLRLKIIDSGDDASVKAKRIAKLIEIEQLIKETKRGIRKAAKAGGAEYKVPVLLWSADCRLVLEQWIDMMGFDKESTPHKLVISWEDTEP